jgi:hypothetical protein
MISHKQSSIKSPKNDRININWSCLPYSFFYVTWSTYLILFNPKIGNHQHTSVYQGHLSSGITKPRGKKKVWKTYLFESRGKNHHFRHTYLNVEGKVIILKIILKELWQ